MLTAGEPTTGVVNGSFVVDDGWEAIGVAGCFGWVVMYGGIISRLSTDRV